MVDEALGDSWVNPNPEGGGEKKEEEGGKGRRGGMAVGGPRT